MTSPVRYGKSLTISRNGDVVTTTEQVYANFDTVKEVHQMTEIVRVTDDKEILSIFLKLLDEQTAGNIDMIGIQCLRNPDTGAMRVEKSWVVPSLQ